MCALIIGFEFSSVFYDFPIAQSVIFCVMVFRSLFVLFSFCWPLNFLFCFDLRLLFTPLVATSVSSYGVVFCNCHFVR